MLPNYLQLCGVVLLILFLFAVWPPLALLGSGVAFLLIGLSLEGAELINGSP